MVDNKKPTILFDSNQLAYAGHFASQNSQQLNYKGMNTSVIFYFLKMVISVFKRYRSNRMVFAWDSRKSIRKVLFPSYKEGRRDKLTDEERRKLDESFIQFYALRTVILPSMGFANIFRCPGYESDDIIAGVLEQLGDKEEAVIISSDHDFYQLLDEATKMYDPKKGKEFTDSWFRREFAIEPSSWADVLSIAGCSTDCVPGVPGVGVKTAVKYLRGELKGRLLEKIENSGDDIAFYRTLVSLPLDGIKPLRIKDNYLGEKRVWENFEYYGFHSFMREEGWGEWQALIDGEDI